MAIVIPRGPIPPQPTPLPTAGQAFGGAGGQLAGQFLIALLQKLGATPTQGQFTAPGGATTAISPAERTASGQPLATSLQDLQSQGAVPQGAFRATGARGVLGRAFPEDIDRIIKQTQLANAPLQRQVLEQKVAVGEAEAEDLPQRRAREIAEQQLIKDRSAAAKSLAKLRESQAQLFENIQPMTFEEAKALIAEARKLGHSDADILAEIEADTSIIDQVKQQLIKGF